MKTIKYVIPLLLFVVTTLTGQIREFSLEECIALAKEHNVQVKNQQYTIAKLENAIATSKGDFLPDLNFNATQGYNLGDSFNISTNLGQRESSYSIFGLASSTTIFEGKARTNQLKYSKLNVERGELEKIQRELEVLVTNDYLQVLLFKEAMVITKNQFELSEKQLARVDILYENGIVTKKELLENRSQVETDRKNKITASINYKNALLTMSERIWLDKTDYVGVQNLDVSSVENTFLLVSEINLENNLEAHPIISASKTDIKLQNLKLKIGKAAFYPSLRFNYEYGSSYYHLLGEEDLVFNSITKEFEANGFFKQLDNNKSHNLIFSLTVPIFNRLATRSTLKQSKNDYEIAKINFKENKKLLFNKSETAYNDMLAAKAAYDANKLTVQFQEEVFRVSTEQYESGIINIYNFIDSKNRFLTTQSDFIKSKYEYLLKIKILEFYLYFV